MSAALGLMTVGAAAADTGALVFPDYKDAADVDARCDRFIEQVQRLQASIAGDPDEGHVLAGMDGVAQAVDDTLAPLSFVANVHPSKPVRDAAEGCELRYQAFSSKLYQDAAIYRRLSALEPADAIDAQMRKDLMALFEDAGVNLTPQRRAQARTLNNAIGRVSQAFERRVREEHTKLAFTEQQLAGVPPAVWQDAKRDANGRVLLGLDYPTYYPVLDNARNAATRERMWRAFQRRGGRENIERLAQLGQMRRTYARLFGLPSYADFVLRRRMAASVANVQAFLGEVQAVAGQRERLDLADLRAAKAADLKQPLDKTVLERWDVGYYTEQVKRQRFALDQETFRRYFPPQASVDFLFELAGRLFGVGFRPLAQTLWHADAKAYEVHDLGSGRTLATLYLDLYPRQDKYGHAAVWPLRGSSTLAGRLPAAALVTNFNRRGLTLRELETLLHEFGHALHNVLSHTRYATQAGTNVKLDFVEAPSQMLEEWVYDARVLALFQKVCASCEPVPADLLARAVRARDFGKGVQVARQHLYASYDLALYGKDAPPPMQLWARMEGATPLSFEPGSLFPAAFAHVAGGYAAGYYAYLWSLATAKDLFTAFRADPLDAAVGQRYRDDVLANGGQVEPTELVTRFLGRAPSNKAFFDWLRR